MWARFFFVCQLAQQH
uniref:Uncharacterized protein n=1 Tax=Arundo donax TaxID=35708 RepID=A0A0A9A0C1_ARUDO